MSRDGKKTTARWAAIARRAGWKVTLTGREHLKWIPPDPDATIIHSAATPNGGKRSLDNLRSQLRRAGLNLTGN